MDVDGSLEALDVGALHGLEELETREDAARLTPERGQQPELGGRERKRDVAEPGLVGGEVDLEAAVVEDEQVGRRLRRPDVRRRIARTRATSSRGEKGFTR